MQARSVGVAQTRRPKRKGSSTHFDVPATSAQAPRVVRSLRDILRIRSSLAVATSQVAAHGWVLRRLFRLPSRSWSPNGVTGVRCSLVRPLSGTEWDLSSRRVPALVQGHPNKQAQKASSLTLQSVRLSQELRRGQRIVWLESGAHVHVDLNGLEPNFLSTAGVQHSGANRGHWRVTGRDPFGIAWTWRAHELPHELADTAASALETHDIHNRLAMVTDATVRDAAVLLARAREYVYVVTSRENFTARFLQLGTRTASLATGECLSLDHPRTLARGNQFPWRNGGQHLFSRTSLTHSFTH